MTHDTPNPEWWPEWMLDEAMPEGRAAPADWIRDGQIVDYLAGSNPDGSDREHLRPLADGEIVTFVGMTDLGSATLSMADDGTWSCDAPMPEAATECWSPGMGGSETSIEGCAEAIRDLQEGGEVAGDYKIRFGDWNSERLRWNAATGQPPPPPPPTAPGQQQSLASLIRQFRN